MQNHEYAIGRLTVAACSGMFVCGIVMALVGAVLPSLDDVVSIGPADIGRLFLAMNAAMLASSLVAGLVIDRFGMRLPLAVAPMLVAGAVLIIRQAASFPQLMGAMVLLGIGSAPLNGAANTLISDLHDDPARKGAALNRLGIFFGFGALFLPFALGRLNASTALAGAVVLCGAVGGFAALQRFPAPKQRHALLVGEIPRFLRSPLVMVLAVMLFFESGVEFTLGGFISTYLVREIGVRSVTAALWILAAFWASIMISRAVLSRAAVAWKLDATVTGSAAVACLGAAVAALAPGPGLAAVGIVLCGAALAGVFPAVLAIAGARFPSHSGTVFGILFAVALSGGMALPWAAGQVGATAGLRWVFGIVAASFAAIAVLSRAIRTLSSLARSAHQP